MRRSIRCTNPACRKAFVYRGSGSSKSFRCTGCGQELVLGEQPNSTPMQDPTSGNSSADSSDRPSGKSLGLENHPEVIEGFQIRLRLGRGAYGTVYRAFDPQLDREVALKIPHQNVLDNPKRIERFLREARSAAKLRHPHIVPVFDAGKSGDLYYIAYSFIDGQPLSEAIEERGIGFRRAARIVFELAGAVAYAHEQGIVHRDIKPANVMLDSKDHVHLMDFGLAATTEGTEKFTNDGALLGTPSYMAPEQATGQQGEANPASDQYALGVVLYELLTGRTPFEGSSQIVLYHTIHSEPEAPSTYRMDPPVDLETICLKALAKNPQDRYPDCQSMADDLRRWLEGEPISARRLSSRERFVRWCRKEPKLAISMAIASICLLLVAIGGIVLSAQLSASAQIEREQRTETEKALRLTELARSDALTAQRKAEAETQRALKAEEDLKEALKIAEEQKNRALLAQQLADEERKKVELAKKEADAKTEEALKAKKDSDEARSSEAKQREEAQLALKEAERAKRKVEEALQRVEKERYARIINQAIQLINENPQQASTILKEIDPVSRGPEWHYLNRRIQKDRAFNRNFRLNVKGYAQSIDFHDTNDALLVATTDSVYALSQFLPSAKNPSPTIIKTHDYQLGPLKDASMKVLRAPIQSARWYMDSMLAFGIDTNAKQTTMWVDGKPFPISSNDPSKFVLQGADGNATRISDRWTLNGGGAFLQMPIQANEIGEPTAGCFSPKRERAAFGSRKGYLVLWDGKTVHGTPPKLHTDEITCLCFSKDQKYIATGSKDQTICLWLPTEQEKHLTLTGHKSTIRSLSFNPQNDRLLSTDEEGNVYLWNLVTGQQLLSLSNETKKKYFTTMFSPKGEWIFGISKDLYLSIWDLRELKTK